MQYKQNLDILQFIIDNGMININDVQNSTEIMKREELLKKHPYKIWKGKDDKWYTYLPDKVKGRILKKRTTKKSIEDEVRIKTYSFRKRLYSICDKTGIARKSPHKIRKTYASILRDNQVSEKFITDLMGHTDIQCTNQFYAHNRKTNEKK